MQGKPSRPVLNRAHPLARGLVSAYPFAAKTTLINTSVTQTAERDQASGSYIKRQGVASGSRITKWGDGLKLDGGAAEGVFSETKQANAIVGRAPVTLSAHVWGFTAGAGSQFFVGASQNGAAGAGVMDLAYNPAAGLFCGRYAGADEFAATPLVGTSFHIVGTYDGSAIRLYIDGAFKSSATSTQSVTAFTATAVGGYVTNNQLALATSANATIADARIWARCLSPADVAALYANPWDMYRPTPRSIRGATAAATRAYYYRNFVASRAG